MSVDLPAQDRELLRIRVTGIMPVRSEMIRSGGTGEGLAARGCVVWCSRLEATAAAARSLPTCRDSDSATLRLAQRSHGAEPVQLHPREDERDAAPRAAPCGRAGSAPVVAARVQRRTWLADFVRPVGDLSRPVRRATGLRRGCLATLMSRSPWGVRAAAQTVSA